MSREHLDDLYATHLETVMRRADASLAAAGFDALVIHSGNPPVQFLDDQSYPYKVNPHFKAWVPILDNPLCVLIHVPDKRPRLLFHQPADFWHKASCMPTAAWAAGIDLVAMPDPALAAQHWAKLGRVACIGPAECFELVYSDGASFVVDAQARRVLSLIHI